MKRTLRSCIACGRRGGKGELIRLAYTPAAVVIDYTERLPGRGAYVCFDPVCIGRALEARKLSRAFRRKVEAPEPEGFYAGLAAKASAKADALIGMAKKSGALALGLDASVAAMDKGPDGLLILARDAARGTAEKALGAARKRGAETARHSTGEGLGALLGRASVVVLYVTGASMAAALKRQTERLMIINGGETVWRS